MNNFLVDVKILFSANNVILFLILWSNKNLLLFIKRRHFSILAYILDY